jgi:hypothetical protein
MVVMVLLALLALPPVAPAAAQQSRTESTDARIAVTLWANPSITVTPGERLGIKFRVENYGSRLSAYTRLYLVYDASQLTPVDTLFERDGDYVETLNPRMTLYIDGVGDGSSRSGAVFFRVADHLPHGTVINLWAEYDWEGSDGNYGLNERSNATPVVVSDANRTSELVWMAVDPVNAPLGSEIGFFSDRFKPGERVDLYVRGANGNERRYRDYSAHADPEGRVWLRFDTGELIPGPYTAVLRGDRTELTAAAEFGVAPPGD